MLIKKPSDIPASEITDPQLYLNRRKFIQSSAGLLLGAVSLWQGRLARAAEASPRRLEA